MPFATTKRESALTIGVVLATYNGAAYLKEQLDCLLKQDILPHHVVIADDGSTDATPAMVSEFAQSAPFPVIFLNDQPRLGATKNFLRVAHASDADLIAFCDQDDLWHPAKLRLSRAAFDDAKVMGAMHTYREFRTSQTGVSIPGRLVRVPARVVDGLNLAPILLWPGMSLIVRRQILPAAMVLRTNWQAHFLRIATQRPLAIEDYWCHMHDALMLNTARLLGSIAMIDQPLADHRLHAQNHTQTKKNATQAAAVSSSWGTSRVVPYRKIGEFCADFSQLLAVVGQDILAPDRNRQAQATYERWAGIWRTRALLHAEDAKLGARVAAFAALGLRRGAYQGRMQGGLGVRSFVKDGAAIAGIRLQ